MRNIFLFASCNPSPTPRERLVVICYFIFSFLEGKRHDSGMLADSNLLDYLEQYAFSSTGVPLCLYGDPAYPLRVHLHDMMAFNTSMSTVMISVEWIFGEITNSFKFLDFKNTLKIGLSTVGKYTLCVL